MTTPGAYRATVVSNFGGGMMQTQTGDYEAMTQLAQDYIAAIPGDKVVVSVNGPFGRVWSYEVDKTRGTP